MNCKRVCASLFIFTLLLFLSGTLHAVQAESDGHIYFSSGVCLYSPLNRTYNSRQLTLNITFGAGMGLKHMLTYDIDGEYDGHIPLVLEKPTEIHVINPTIGLVVLPELSDGSHRLTIHVVCGLYNYYGAGPPGAPFKPTAPGSSNYEASWTHIIYFTIDSNEPYQPQPPEMKDSTAPTIAHISLGNTTYHAPDLPLNFTVDEPVSWTGYSLDGQRNVTVGGNVTLLELSVGQHTLTVYANDTAGNSAASETISFIVAESESFSTLPVAAASGASVAAVAAGAVVCWKKRKR